MSWLTRRIHGHADRTLAPSTASLRQLEALDVPRLALWPRGVDLEAFHPRFRDDDLRRSIAPDGRLLVGYVGRLAPEKELELLTYLSSDPRYALVVVGGGPEESTLRRLLPDASFLGVLTGDDLSRAYASLDVFVHTGRHETYCQSAQEALASGVPVVAPRAGGPIDVVADGTAGFLYEPGDGDDLGGYVDRLARDPLFRRRMGLAARASVEGRSWASVNAPSSTTTARSSTSGAVRPRPDRRWSAHGPLTPSPSGSARSSGCRSCSRRSSGWTRTCTGSRRSVTVLDIAACPTSTSR